MQKREKKTLLHVTLFIVYIFILSHFILIIHDELSINTRVKCVFLFINTLVLINFFFDFISSKVFRSTPLAASFVVYYGP